MKKLVLIIVALFSFASCENPSVEEGLASLEASLAELQAAMSGVDVNQMLADIATMQDQVETMETDIEGYELQVAEWELQIQNILADLEGVQAIIDDAATKSQTDAIMEDLTDIQEMIDILVLIADYDYDGVVNGLDQCPDTELGLTVNEQGCSEEQAAALTATASSTTTSSTGG
jgi:hypothetical protein